MNLVHQMFSTARSQPLVLFNSPIEGKNPKESFQDLLSTLQENRESLNVPGKADIGPIDEMVQKLRRQLNELFTELKFYQKETDQGSGQGLKELEQLAELQIQFEDDAVMPSDLDILTGLESALKMLQGVIKAEETEGGNSKEETSLVKDPKVSDLFQTINETIHLVQNVLKGTEEQKKKMSNDTHFITLPISSNVTQLEKSQLLNNFEQKEIDLQKLWVKFQQNIHSLENNNRDAHSKVNGYSTKVLVIKDVIQSISQISNQVPEGKWTSMLSKLSEQGTEFENKLFRGIWNTYQNRQTVPSGYQRLSPINGKEMGKWISQYIEKHTDNSRTSASSLQTMPMSKVEQHVIQIHQNQPSSSIPNQFMKELERILQSSRWFTSKPGSMEMQLKLKPLNLGEMTVKLAQINGELTVKIIASSQAAKEMLESNMGQLRHMFSPQQVVVEKNEGLSDQPSFYSFDEDQAGHEEQKEKQSNQIDSDSEEQSEDGESFYDILMNEKV
ncbi:flagellar hook-length control protein FliK [Halobacillus halophilus]|uniref:Homolog to flagellar hook-length control protein n=1 Tax=Halobacillus halophilus (strain ATCC 35676 / DSM 2266 / JCM 20832 / KCTC 3685 / LMG 17431 / NBRC 102448 / NCIMB 2269) TaxID=866895 RepID=I0JML5_HALH3|nr:flagellar hook-length control protein FliK [Halobacillus halophilus]ASF39466.1 flagellar hook-length control protein FliK [Halobacillus halophilus]CCG45385.1 homolog to flagellar hook-length control protein [Halobacillus halophilus DSM 2266]